MRMLIKLHVYTKPPPKDPGVAVQFANLCVWAWCSWV